MLTQYIAIIIPEDNSGPFWFFSIEDIWQKIYTGYVIPNLSKLYIDFEQEIVRSISSTSYEEACKKFFEFVNDTDYHITSQLL